MIKNLPIFILIILALTFSVNAIEANLVSYYPMGNTADSLGRADLTVYGSPENLSSVNCLNGLCSRVHGSGSGSSTPFDSYSTYSNSFGDYLNGSTDICIDFYFNGTIQSGGFWQMNIQGTGAARGHSTLAIQTTGTANQFLAFYSDSGGGSSSTAFTVNTSVGYHYYAFCRTGNRFIVYEDTTLMVNGTVTARSPTAPFYLTFAGNEPAGGSNYGHSSSYLAMYDEVGVWNSLLTYDDIVQRAEKNRSSFYPFGATLANFTTAYFSLDETSGEFTDLVNEVPTTYLSGTFNYGQSGKIGTSISGENSPYALVSGQNQTFFEPHTDDFSVSFWYKPNVTTGNSRILGTDNYNLGSTYAGWFFTHQSGGNIEFIIRNSTQSFQYSASAGTLINNVWYHIIGIRNGSKIHIIKDGVLIASTTINPTLDAAVSIDGLKIGSIDDSEVEKISGGIDEIAYFKGYVLSSDDIEILYNGGSPDAATSRYPYTISSDFDFTGDTPDNNTAIYYTSSFVIDVTAQNFANTPNITIFLYNETESLITEYSVINYLSDINISGLTTGLYYFNATADDNITSAYTETRTVYIYNISEIITTSASTSSGIYSINWTNATITPSSAPVSVSNFAVNLYNASGTKLKYTGTFTELNLTNYNLYLNGIKENQYLHFKITVVDSEGYNVTTNTTSFYLDYPDGYLQARAYFNFTNGFGTSITTTLNYSCINELNTSATINATFNGAGMKYGAVTNNTIYTNTTQLKDGTNTLIVNCSDFNTAVVNTTSWTAYVKSIYLIDEKDNALFTVSNLTSVRVYYDSNSTYYDFKAAGTNHINISINDTDSLRFEFIRSSGETVITYVNLGLLDTQARICVNKDDVTQYEQGIVSSQIKGAVLKNVFSNCVVAADYTRFAYENSFILKAYTIHALYYLYTYVDGVKTYLASVDGSIQNLIKLDVLEYSRAEVPANVIGDAVGIEVYTNASAWITYLNYLNNSASAGITITRLDTGEVVFTTTETESPNYFTILFDFSTLNNITDNTLFMLSITRTNTNGETFLIKRYFTSTGSAGNIPSSYAYAISLGIAIFGLTIVTVAAALSWFGILSLVVALFVLALAPFTTATLILGVSELILIIFLFSLNLISNTQGRGGVV